MVAVWAEIGSGGMRGNFAMHPEQFDGADKVDPAALFQAHPEYVRLWVRDVRTGALLDSYERAVVERKEGEPSE